MIVFFYLVFSFFLIFKFRISIPLLFIYSGSIFILGILTFSDEVFIRYLKLNLISNMFLLFGFYIGKIFNKKHNYINFVSFNYKGILYFYIFSSLLILVHYFLIGIPILSANYDVNRFTLSSSGYGGLPSRIAIYIPMLFFFIWFLIKDKINIDKNFKIFLIFFVIIALVLQGHKSSILQLFYATIIAYKFTSDRLKNKLWILFIIIFSIIFAFVSFKNLSTINNLTLYNYLFDRYTIILHQPGFTLFNLSKNDFNFFSQNIILSDLLYPLLKFLNFDVQTLNDQLSRIVYGIIYKDDFSVPVTPGWFSYHYFVFGNNIFLTMFLSLLFGTFLSIVENYGLNSNNFHVKVISLYVLYFSYVGYTSGNFYYLVINVVFCFVIFLAFYLYKLPNIKNEI